MATSAVRESEVDVLVIGAGPAGLMAANALAKNGINVRIIDLRAEKVAAGQADGIQPRTLEILQSYGLADRLFRDGAQLHMAAFYNPSPTGGIELTDRVPDVTAPTARYPFELTLHQGEIESIFLDSMRKFGVEVGRPISPQSIELSSDASVLSDPQGYAVQTVLQHIGPDRQGETEIVRAKYVIGADGAHSWVRKSFSISMIGEQTKYIWGVVDFTPDTDFPDIRNRTAIHSNNGSCMVIPREGDKVRLYIQLDEHSGFLNSEGRVNKTEATPYQLLDMARKSFHPFTIQTPKEFDWWTIYIIGQRVASQFSIQDRIFIVGDACHTHSPKAGQGMNASMSDSHNLAWKLTHVLNGWANKSLLQTYEFERKKYAEDLINFDKEFAKLFSGKPRTEEYQDGVSHEDFLKIFQTFGGFTSGIGIQYADSIITRRPPHPSSAKNIIIGQRILPQVFMRAADSRPVEIQDLLPSDARFKILVFTGDSSNSARLERLHKTATDMTDVLERITGGKIYSLFDILAITSTTKAKVRYIDLPQLFRSHWSKVLIDDMDATGKKGGDGYLNYGIDASGAIVVVRPDGYVGTVVPLEGVSDIASYSNTFIKVN